MRLQGIGGVLVVVLALIVDLLLWGGVRGLRSGGTLPIGVIPVLTAVIYALLPLRWRRPVAVFAVQWVYSLAGLLVPGYAPFAGLLVALHAVACRSTRRTAALALAASAVPFGIDSYYGAAQRIHVKTAFIVAFAVQFFMYAILTITVWGLGRLSNAAERRRQQQAVEVAQAERLRLAREMHDSVSNAVNAMQWQAAAAIDLVGTQDEQVRKSLALILEIGKQTGTELHRLLGLLRAADREDADTEPGRQPRLEDLATLVDLGRASGLDVEVTTDGSPGRLDPSVDLAAYRILQEALTNTTKHAGRGATVRIHLQWHPDHLTITVRDTPALEDGAETCSAWLSSGYGLEGLTERVSIVGGRLDVGPVPGGGFLLNADLPFSPAAHSDSPLTGPTP